MSLRPVFDTSLLEPEVILAHVEELIGQSGPISHDDLLRSLIEQLEPIDFLLRSFPQVQKIRNDDAKEKEITKIFKVLRQHYLIVSIENIREVATRNRWGLCKNMSFIYLYNGTYWKELEKETIQKFLGEAAEKMGVNWSLARYYQFREQLFKQFMATEYMPTPVPCKDKVLINLKNGTFEVTPEGTKIRGFNPNDFMTYQLPFEYIPEAQAPIFQAYLDKVLPNKLMQMILAEYLGYVFMKHGSNSMKLEKVLVLYGSGANGKSVLHEVVNALLGHINVSSYSIQSLTDENGYFRAMLANKLVNYASEINGNLQTSIFKQLVSGEPVEARLPYGQPFSLTQYAKLIFNCNELPKEVEHTHAYFRRFLIIPFEVTIPEEEQDKQLHHKINDAELSGVFNWVLEGLSRLLRNKNFTYCEPVKLAREQYEKQSDSIRLFIEESGYQKSTHSFELIMNLYTEYRGFCIEDGFRPVNKSNFILRLKGLGIDVTKRNVGNVAFLSKPSEPF